LVKLVTRDNELWVWFGIDKGEWSGFYEVRNNLVNRGVEVPGAPKVPTKPTETALTDQGASTER
jgi:hypothetical protein